MKERNFENNDEFYLLNEIFNLYKLKNKDNPNPLYTNSLYSKNFEIIYSKNFEKINEITKIKLKKSSNIEDIIIDRNNNLIGKIRITNNKNILKFISKNPKRLNFEFCNNNKTTFNPLLFLSLEIISEINKEIINSSNKKLNLFYNYLNIDNYKFEYNLNRNITTIYSQIIDKDNNLWVMFISKNEDKTNSNYFLKGFKKYKIIN